MRPPSVRHGKPRVEMARHKLDAEVRDAQPAVRNDELQPDVAPVAALLPQKHVVAVRLGANLKVERVCAAARNDLRRQGQIRALAVKAQGKALARPLPGRVGAHEVRRHALAPEGVAHRLGIDRRAAERRVPAPPCVARQQRTVFRREAIVEDRQTVGGDGHLDRTTLEIRPHRHHDRLRRGPDRGLEAASPRLARQGNGTRLVDGEAIETRQNLVYRRVLCVQRLRDVRQVVRTFEVEANARRKLPRLTAKTVHIRERNVKRRRFLQVEIERGVRQVTFRHADKEVRAVAAEVAVERPSSISRACSKTESFPRIVPARDLRLRRARHRNRAFRPAELARVHCRKHPPEDREAAAVKAVFAVGRRNFLRAVQDLERRKRLWRGHRRRECRPCRRRRDAEIVIAHRQLFAQRMMRVEVVLAARRVGPRRVERRPRAPVAGDVRRELGPQRQRRRKRLGRHSVRDRRQAVRGEPLGREPRKDASVFVLDPNLGLDLVRPRAVRQVQQLHAVGFAETQGLADADDEVRNARIVPRHRGERLSVEERTVVRENARVGRAVGDRRLEVRVLLGLVPLEAHEDVRIQQQDLVEIVAQRLRAVLSVHHAGEPVRVALPDVRAEQLAAILRTRHYLQGDRQQVVAVEAGLLAAMLVVAEMIPVVFRTAHLKAVHHRDRVLDLLAERGDFGLRRPLALPFMLVPGAVDVDERHVADEEERRNLRVRPEALRPPLVPPLLAPAVAPEDELAVQARRVRALRRREDHVLDLRIVLLGRVAGDDDHLRIARHRLLLFAQPLKLAQMDRVVVERREAVQPNLPQHADVLQESRVQSADGRVPQAAVVEERTVCPDVQQVLVSAVELPLREDPRAVQPPRPRGRPGGKRHPPLERDIFGRLFRTGHTRRQESRNQSQPEPKRLT